MNILHCYLVVCIFILHTSAKTALLIVDVQNCFIDGSMAVPNGKQVIHIINTIRESIQFDSIVITRDYHPDNHISFITSYKDVQLYDTIELKYTSDGHLCESPIIQ